MTTPNDSYWTNRRTIRRYTDKHVPDELLRDMLLKASHAPTTGNMQLYSVIVSRGKETISALSPAHFNQPQLTGCDVVLTFCADLNRFTRWCQERDADPAYDNLQSLMAAILDTVAVTQQFITIAEQHGLGTCWLGTTTYNAGEIAHILNLPPRVIPIATITVGYPDEKPADCGRLPVEAFIHEETYHDYSPQDIDRLYAEKEARPDSMQFVKENNLDTLAQVFTNVRYPRVNNELFSKKLADFLNKSLSHNIC